MKLLHQRNMKRHRVLHHLTAWGVALAMIITLIGPTTDIASAQSGGNEDPDGTSVNIYLQEKYDEGEVGGRGAPDYHYASPQEMVGAASIDVAPIFSDNFNRNNLDPTKWTFKNPLDDGQMRMVGAGSGDARLELSVPEGVSHDPWGSNKSVRVMQPAPDSDFTVVVKFDSIPSQKFQTEGIIIEQDPDNWMRVDVLYDGANLRLFVATTVNGVTSGVPGTDSDVLPGAAVYLKLTRSGDDWTASYSTDGNTYSTVVNFTYALTVSQIGPFAANHASSGQTPPAFTAEIDCFVNTTSPIDCDNEGTPPADTLDPYIYGVDWVSPTSGEMTVTWYTDEPASGVVKYGLTTGYELGSESDPNASAYKHTVQLTGLQGGQTYHMRVRSVDGDGNIANGEDIEFNFDTITVWYGDTQNYGQLGNSQPWINILGRVSSGAAQLYYRLNGDAPVRLTIGPNLNRLQNRGDFNIDLARDSLVDGANTVEILAYNADGNLISTKNVTVNYQSGNVWPLPYSVDWSTIGSPAQILTKAEIIDGKWKLDGGGVRTDEPGYDRFIGMGDLMWNDYEVTVPIIINELPDSGEFGIGLLLRWRGHSDRPKDCGQPKCGYLPMGALAWYHGNVTSDGNIKDHLQLFGIYDDPKDDPKVDPPFEVNTGATYWLKVRVETNVNGGLYRLKFWEDGQTEPTDWNLEAQEDLQDPQRGSVVLVAHQADVTFGDVNIVQAGSGTNFPPVANDDAAIVAPSGTVLVNVLANDGKPGGALDPGTVTIVQPPIHGTAGVDPVTGLVTYSHDGSDSTSDSFAYRVSDDEGTQSNVANVAITISEDAPREITSDDFARCTLQPFWTVTDPYDDSDNSIDGPGEVEIIGAGSGDAHLALRLPSGTAYNAWTSGRPNVNKALRVMQPAPNTNFVIEAHFNTEPQGDSNDQGILIEQDTDNFLRFDVYHTGSKLKVLAGSVTNGATKTEFTVNAPVDSTYYLRVTRNVNQWTVEYSPDGEGSTWTTAGTVDFPLNVTKVGVYAANPNAVAYTAEVDYFFNNDDRINPEDGSRNTLDVQFQGIGTVIKSPEAETYACGQEVQLTANPGAGYKFDRWSGAVSGLANPETVTINGPTAVTANFVPEDTDQPPVLTIQGDNPLVIEVGDPYVEQGATATDPEDGDISAQIQIDSSSVNTNKLGLYTVTYSVTDSGSNTVEAERAVSVVDTTPPVITLKGANPLKLAVGDPYNEAGATAVDNVDGDLTAAIVVGGDVVDTSKEGTYLVTYSVSDSSGNAATATRSVIVGNAGDVGVYLPIVVNGE